MIKRYWNVWIAGWKVFIFYDESFHKRCLMILSSPFLWRSACKECHVLGVKGAGGKQKLPQSFFLRALAGFLMLDVWLPKTNSSPLNKWCLGNHFPFWVWANFHARTLRFGECSDISCCPLHVCQGLEWDSTHQHWKDWQEGHPSKIARSSTWGCFRWCCVAFCCIL